MKIHIFGAQGFYAVYWYLLRDEVFWSFKNEYSQGIQCTNGISFQLITKDQFACVLLMGPTLRVQNKVRS
jgi:hypothetical protein